MCKFVSFSNLLLLTEKTTSRQVLFEKVSVSKLNIDIHWFHCFNKFFFQIRCTPATIKTGTPGFTSVKILLLPN